MTAARPASLIALQPAISASVRPHPVQWVRAGSSAQIERQGVSIT